VEITEMKAETSAEEVKEPIKTKPNRKMSRP